MKNPIIVSSDVKLGMQALLNIYAADESRCVMIGSASCRPLSRSSLCSSFVEHTLEKEGDLRLLQAIESLAAGLPEPVILPTDCKAARAVLRLQPHLRTPCIPLPSAEQLELFDDKWRFYEYCRANDFPVPDSLRVSGKHEINYRSTVSAIGLPFVVKPLAESGSRGVHVVYNQDYLEREILANPEYDFGALVLQRFIDGDDGGLSLFGEQGKLRAFAVQHYVKDGIRFAPDDALETLAERFCQTASFNGLVNLDVRFERGTGKRWLLEANPRLWSSIYACTWCGLNMVDLSLNGAQAGSAPRALISGWFHDRRHPLIWPPAWPYVLAGRGSRGRIARAMMFDRYMLPQFLASVPARAGRFLRRQLVETGPVTRPRA
jgi:hypothetical protein